MATYKVPQDVEADDKLIGPFSFRQFIYLIGATLGVAMAWALSQIFIGLVIIPLPFVLLFGALALPLRKDQPMEIYLAAMVKFFFKPRLRLWQPEGQVNLVTIIAPRTDEHHVTLKDFTADEAQQRLSYLAQVIDTQGWASRGVTNTALASLNDTITAEASTANDILDDSVGIGRQFDSLIEQQDEIRHRQMTNAFQTAMQQPAPTQQSPAVFPLPSSQPAATAASPTPPAAVDVQPVAPLSFNPYPTSMHQHVIDPHGSSATPAVDTTTMPTAVTASDNPPSPDIMRLASNKDLSISAIAREAHRIEEDGEEVVVSLR